MGRILIPLSGKALDRPPVETSVRPVRPNKIEDYFPIINFLSEVNLRDLLSDEGVNQGVQASVAPKVTEAVVPKPDLASVGPAKRGLIEDVEDAFNKDKLINYEEPFVKGTPRDYGLDVSLAGEKAKIDAAMARAKYGRGKQFSDTHYKLSDTGLEKPVNISPQREPSRKPLGMMDKGPERPVDVSGVRPGTKALEGTLSFPKKEISDYKLSQLVFKLAKDYDEEGIDFEPAIKKLSTEELEYISNMQDQFRRGGSTREDPIFDQVRIELELRKRASPPPGPAQPAAPQPSVTDDEVAKAIKEKRAIYDGLKIGKAYDKQLKEFYSDPKNRNKLPPDYDPEKAFPTKEGPMPAPNPALLKKAEQQFKAEAPLSGSANEDFVGPPPELKPVQEPEQAQAPAPPPPAQAAPTAKPASPSTGSATPQQKGELAATAKKLGKEKGVQLLSIAVKRGFISPEDAKLMADSAWVQSSLAQEWKTRREGGSATPAVDTVRPSTYKASEGPKSMADVYNEYRSVVGEDASPMGFAMFADQAMGKQNKTTEWEKNPPRTWGEAVALAREADTAEEQSYLLKLIPTLKGVGPRSVKDLLFGSPMEEARQRLIAYFPAASKDSPEMRLYRYAQAYNMFSKQPREDLKAATTGEQKLGQSFASTQRGGLAAEKAESERIFRDARLREIEGKIAKFRTDAEAKIAKMSRKGGAGAGRKTALAFAKVALAKGGEQDKLAKDAEKEATEHQKLGDVGRAAGIKADELERKDANGNYVYGPKAPPAPKNMFLESDREKFKEDQKTYREELKSYQDKIEKLRELEAKGKEGQARADAARQRADWHKEEAEKWTNYGGDLMGRYSGMPPAPVRSPQTKPAERF